MRGDGKTFPWVWAALLAGGGLLGALNLINWRGPELESTERSTRRNETEVNLTPWAEQLGADESASALELSLNDPTPLFLPTPYNSGRVEMDMTAERSPGIAFDVIGSKLVFPESGNQLAVPDVVHLDAEPLQVLENLAPRVVLAELPREAFAVDPLAGRQAILEVRRVLDGKVMWEEIIPVQSEGVQDGIAPLDLLVLVNEAGMVTSRGAVELAASGGGAPLLDQQPVNLSALSKLLRVSQFEGRLAAGIYRISLGP
ncbi:hypothetical protein [Actomonas aquatica]|uniref:SAF domain-containing protein n=1 Tax=Actomonas aquatica TaxID=2866162 RepID=A0ABZ1CE46_9BACT|nr:hypothetical protein [Opitutus sp. WL0086]WRQ89687.1 hypothetical protein K1X11_009735 [Opitutus sp. WL0086]